MTYKAIIHAFEYPKFIKTTKLSLINIKNNMILTACYTSGPLNSNISNEISVYHPILLFILHASKCNNYA